MKESTKGIIAASIFVAIILSLVGGLVWTLVGDELEEENNREECENIFPSPLEKDIYGREIVWQDNYAVEEGYIKCCRRYLENHEIKEECKIFTDGGE